MSKTPYGRKRQMIEPEKLQIDTVLGIDLEEAEDGIQISQVNESMGQTNLIFVDFSQLNAVIDFLEFIQEKCE